MQPKIKAHCPYIGTTGYNHHSRDFFRALSKKVDLQIRNFTIGKSWKELNNEPHNNESYLINLDKKLLVEQTLWNSNKDLEDFSVYKNYSNNFAPNIDLVLNEVGHYYFYQTYNNPKIAYVVGESTLYPQDFFEKLKEFDQVWVPSKWQAKCSIQQGLDPDKVKVVPEAVDGDTFKPSKFKQTSDYKDNRFKFLLFGKWEYRKSTKEIIETFLKEFSSDEPVDLILSVDNPYADDGFSSTEERLFHFNLQDSRIKVKHFPSRKDYIRFLQNGHVFLSCARSEGWNLPLIEAMACGTPSIYSNCSGQLEFAQEKGLPVKIIGEKPIPNGVGNYYEPDFQDLAKQMRKVYSDYQTYKEKALKDSKEIRNIFTWEKMADIGYNNLQQLQKMNIPKFKPIKLQNIELKNHIDISFIKGAKVEIKGPLEETYDVKFFDHKTNTLIWNDTLTTANRKEDNSVPAYGVWTAPSLVYYTKWRVEIKNSKGEVVKNHIFDCTGKKVYIHLDSKSLGDTIAWFPYVEEFRKTHKCQVICSTFHNSWFKNTYPEVEFVEPTTIVHDLYAMYEIGWFYNGDIINSFKNPNNPTAQPLQKTASDILGLPYKEIKPTIFVPNKKPNIKEDYVVISPHATKHAAYWNNKGGWQTIINWLNEAGYKVIMISHEKLGDEWHDSKLGGTLTGVIDKTGPEYSFEDRFVDLKHAKLVIGGSSGLAWISWALNTPTLIITGHSEYTLEPTSIPKVYTPSGCCSGCHSTQKLDGADWEWCPFHKGTNRHFECTKSITPDLVAQEISRILQ